MLINSFSPYIIQDKLLLPNSHSIIPMAIHTRNIDNKYSDSTYTQVLQKISVPYCNIKLVPAITIRLMEVPVL